MERRQFLKEAVMAGGLLVIGGTALGVRHAYARRRFVARLMDEARPSLDMHAQAELSECPGSAGNAIQQYFDGKCRNTPAFVSEVCSEEFRQKLRQRRSADQRQQEFLAVFCRRVCTEGDIVEHVQEVAKQIGADLDRHWQQCSDEVARRWDARLRQSGPGLDLEDFARRLAPLLRSYLTAAANQARLVGATPVEPVLPESVGTGALLLMPGMQLTGAGLSAALPLFVWQACRNLFEQVLAGLADHKGEFQEAVTQRLALLGRRVAEECEKEVSKRLTELHHWREGALRIMAGWQADERVGWV